MIWIPIVYFCLTSGDCGFMQGKATYTESGCVELLQPVVKEFNQDDTVVAFDVTCVSVNPI